MPTGMTATINAPAPPPAAAPAPAVPEVKTPLPPGGKIEPAVLINRTMPDYPSLARQRALTGVVKLTAAIDERGNVKDVKYVSGDAVLAAAAKNAVWSWKYKPARLNGKAISATTEIQIVFGDRNK
jgi:periplasmic protein TonB